MIEIDFEFGSEDIPVDFEYEGKHYKGFLSWVKGAGGYVWFLSVNKFYWGQLNYVAEYEWRFYNQKDDMRDYANYFGDVVMAWYE